VRAEVLALRTRELIRCELFGEDDDDECAATTIASRIFRALWYGREVVTSPLTAVLSAFTERSLDADPLPPPY